MTAAPRSRRRTVLIGVAIAAVVAAVYATVVGLYAGSGEVSAGGGASGDDAIVLTLTPEKMDASANRLSVSVLPGQDAGVHTDGFVVNKPFGVLVSAVAGSRAIEYTKDSLLAPAEVSIVTDGAIEEWPFDRYTVTTIVVAAEDVADETVPLPTRIQGAGRVPGWDVSMQGRDVGDGLVAVDVTVSRSGSTVAFGIVLLSLMIVIPILVLIVAIQVFRGRRKVEVTALGWMGAMLFATIPLRNFLPGSPPIGSWIDYLVVLWVLAALVAGLVVFVAAWLRRGPAA